MSKEYIEREALLEIVGKMPLDWEYGQAVSDIWNIIKSMPAVDAIPVPETGIGDVSDGYHTFNVLYHHRGVLFSVICNLMPKKAWKSKLHDTGDMYDGMFIVGIETPEGQATYHYDIDPYWDMFKVKEIERAPKWDRHTPSDAIKRIGAITAADAGAAEHKTIRERFEAAFPRCRIDEYGEPAEICPASLAGKECPATDKPTCMNCPAWDWPAE